MPRVKQISDDNEGLIYSHFSIQQHNKAECIFFHANMYSMLSGFTKILRFVTSKQRRQGKDSADSAQHTRGGQAPPAHLDLGGGGARIFLNLTHSAGVQIDV